MIFMGKSICFPVFSDIFPKKKNTKFVVIYPPFCGIFSVSSRQVPDVVVINANAANAATCLMQEICYCGVQPCESSDRGPGFADLHKVVPHS